jgi:hypothetical protein
MSRKKKRRNRRPVRLEIVALRLAIVRELIGLIRDMMD